MSSRRRGGPLTARIPDELALEVGETGNAAHEIADADLPGGAEIDPLVDPTYVSAMNANRIVRECLTGIAMRKLGLTDKHYLSPLTSSHGRGR